MSKNKKGKAAQKPHKEAITNKSAATELKKKNINQKKVEKGNEKDRTLILLIILIITIVLLVFLANKTFFRTYYSTKINDREVKIEIPRFNYFVSDKDKKISLKTLRKSENTKAYYENYIESDVFLSYTCHLDDNTDKYVYYNKLYNYFLYDIEVTKKFVVKTVQMKYSILNENEICDLFKIVE